MAIIWNSWRDNLKDASFRDIPFKVLSHTAEGGRRTFLHQFPFNDEPYLEDFGKEPGAYRIEAYIVQSTDNAFDYFPLRDLLKEALEQYGPGTLIHPFLGTLRVGVQGKYQLKESFAEGGVARFTVTFVEAGKPQEPVTEKPEIVDLGQKSTSIWKEFGKALQTVNKIGHVVNSAMKQVQYYTNVAQSALLMPISVASSVISEAITTVATIRGAIESVMSIPDQLATLLKGVGQVFSDIADLLPKNNITTDTSLTNACLSMITFGSNFPDVVVSTEDRQTELDNQKMIIDTVRSASMVEAIRSAIAVEYASYEDAVAMRDKLVEAFDYVMTGIGENSKNDTLYQTMSDLRQYSIDVMVFKGANLPVLRSLTVPVDPVPSLAYAQMLYKDISRDAEIVARNPSVMRHPGFPSGGKQLVVLSE